MKLQVRNALVDSGMRSKKSVIGPRVKCGHVTLLFTSVELIGDLTCALKMACTTLLTSSGGSVDNFIFMKSENFWAARKLFSLCPS